MALTGEVLVTGGCGSLGRAILSRAERERWDARFTVYSRSESRQAETRERYPSARFVIGDVRDTETLWAAARGADVIIHAAAQKRVPEAERQPISCARSNVEGSASVVHVARRLGTPRVVGISTDKACSPLNAYGHSKALMERMFQAEALERPSGPSFTLVRYGNVLASTGSVIPIWRGQAERGEPITITDPLMTRFWLTVHDAVELVIRALETPAGTVLIPRCSASSMAALAAAIAPDADVVVTGTRGGEKRHEQLLSAHESPYAEDVQGGFLLRPIVGDEVRQLPEGFEYRSDTAPQFSPAALRAVITWMDAEPTMTLAA